MINISSLLSVLYTSFGFFFCHYYPSCKLQQKFLHLTFILILVSAYETLRVIGSGARLA
jgi:hypothetical protein